MTHLITFLLSLAAFVALALATDRAQRDLLGRELHPATTRGLRAAGWAALVAALAVVVGAQGWPLGLVSYSGHTSLAAGVVFGALILAGRRSTVRDRPSRRSSNTRSLLVK